jgi:transposase-like protein
MITTPSCPRCQSPSVRLAMELPYGRFLICGHCTHRWSVSVGGRRVTLPISARAEAETDQTTDFPPTAA